jgi:hypothetical protein
VAFVVAALMFLADWMIGHGGVSIHVAEPHPRLPGRDAGRHTPDPGPGGRDQVSAEMTAHDYAGDTDNKALNGAVRPWSAASIGSWGARPRE